MKRKNRLIVTENVDACKDYINGKIDYAYNFRGVFSNNVEISPNGTGKSWIVNINPDSVLPLLLCDLPVNISVINGDVYSVYDKESIVDPINIDKLSPMCLYSKTGCQLHFDANPEK